MKILVVDDDPFARKLLVRQLSQLGFGDVQAIASGEEALTGLESDVQCAGLIFCDLQMPGMDGVEFVRHLVRLNYAGGLVLVSGEDGRLVQTVRRLAEGYRLQVLGSLGKPVSLDELRPMLEQSSATPFAVRGAARKFYGADAIRQAIAGGQLVNFYQPKVDLASGSVSGLESLVRWQHPVDGMVFPDQFIHVAEDEGLINALTECVLTNALLDMQWLKSAGHPLPVAVNVSMDNLMDRAFPEFVETALSAAKALPDSLLLEVTESRLMKDPLTPLEILTRLRLKRIHLSIDDFGTGHSSLAQLRDIPFSELKVDRGFVHGACRDHSLRAILEASLGMARQLGMSTVAEGIEDRDDWDFLRWTGCSKGQGWFIARPMPVDRLPAWIEQWGAGLPKLLGESAQS